MLSYSSEPADFGRLVLLGGGGLLRGGSLLFGGLGLRRRGLLLGGRLRRRPSWPALRRPERLRPWRPEPPSAAAFGAFGLRSGGLGGVWTLRAAAASTWACGLTKTRPRARASSSALVVRSTVPSHLVSLPPAAMPVTRSTLSCWRWPRGAAIALATDLLEDLHLLALAGLDQGRRHARAGHRRRAQGDGVAVAQHQHFAERDVRARFASRAFRPPARHRVGPGTACRRS